MRDGMRHWLMVAVLAALVPHCAVSSCLAGDEPAASPATEEAPAPGVYQELPPLKASAQPAGFVLPPPPHHAAEAASQGWIGSPLLDRPQAAARGFFFNVESSVLWAQFTNHLQGGRAPGPYNVGLP